MTRRITIAFFVLVVGLNTLPLRGQYFLPYDLLKLDYLVITADSLKEEFQPLLEWKFRKGLKVGLITMEEIDSIYNERSIQLKIKRCLEWYYETKGLRWVLLGGDERVIPYQGCYGTTNMGQQSVTDYNIPTDLFYACFDKRFDWNGYVDEKIGQIYVDGHDVLPEVDLTRIPVHTREQVRVMVKKILRYEQELPPEGFYETMLLCGVRGWSSWEGLSDSHHRSEVFYKNYVEPYWSGVKTAFYDSGTDFPGSSAYNVSALNLVSRLNSGYSYFQFTGHGNLQQLAMETGRSFHSDDAASLVNPFPGLVLANGCHTNAYDSIEPCLSEAFLRNPEGGAVAYLGNTRFGFGNPNEEDLELGPSLVYFASFAKYLFGPAPVWKNYGALVSMAKEDHYLNGTSGGAFTYLLYSLTPMGDPEMQLYTAAPRIFDNVRIFRFGDEITVNTGGVEMARICATSEDPEAEFQELVEGETYHIFSELPDNYRITITAPGYHPFRYVSGATDIRGSVAADLRIWPNPVAESLYLDWIPAEGQLRLYAVSGLLIREQELHHGRNIIPVSSLSPGTYILQLDFAGGTLHRKILKH